MEYTQIQNIPHFRESFPSPSYKSNEYGRSRSPSCNSSTYIAPLSASSLQAYNMMNHSNYNHNTNTNNITKRKAQEFDMMPNEDLHLANSKRFMIEHPNRIQFSASRQRQESGCSVSSSSSWSSSASFSTVCTTASTTAIVPDLSAPSPNRSQASSRSPSPSESVSNVEEYNPLWHLCDAIDLSEKQDAPIQKSSSKSISNKRDDGMYGLKIVFLEPNWLAEHIAKSKKVVALRRQQQFS